MRKLFYDTSLLCLLILCCPLITSATPRSTLRGFVKIADPSYPSESFIISRKKSPSEFEFFSESGGVTTPVAGLGTLVYGFGELLDSPLSSNGLPDIAVGYGGSLQLLENRGATGFRRTEPLELPDANNATVTTISIDVIDDMREELLSADSGHFTKINSYLSKFTNGYFGLFSPTRGFLPPPLHPDGALDTAKGDVNGDGLDDIVIWNYDSFVVVGYSYALNRSLRVLLNNGDGSFTSSKFPIAAAATNYFPGIAALRDVNRDGALDVIMLRVRPADTLIYVTFNDGNGDFPQALGKLYALGCGSSRWEFEGGGGVGNFVGDSREEFFSISDFSNSSGALFCTFRLRDTPDIVDNWFEFIGSTRVESNFFYHSSGIIVDEIVDFDRDGYSDIFYDSSEGTNQAISYRQLKPIAGNTLQFEPSIKWGKGELNRFPVLQDAIVGAVVLLSNQNVFYTARTNQYGEFIFNDIEPGEYTMRALFPGYQVQARSVSIPSAQNSLIGIPVAVQPPIPTATATPSTTASATPTATPPVVATATATATPTPAVSVTPTPRAIATGSASPSGNTPGITSTAELSLAFTSRPSLRSKRSVRSKLTITNQGPTSCDRVQVTTQITNRAGVAPNISPRAVVVLSPLPAKKKKSTVMTVSLLKKYSLRQFNHVLATAQCLQPKTNSGSSVVTKTAKIIF